MDLNLNNKRVLITAASSGIGKAIAEAFLEEGAEVAICSRNKKNLINAVKEIKKSKMREPLWVVCNINKKADIEHTVQVVNKEFGGIDILVNNCGGPEPGYFENLNDKKWKDAFDQVMLSAIRFTRLALLNMIAQEWGRIINITSISVKQPIDNLILSNSLRSGLTAMAKTLSNEVGKYNITVNNVAPGYTLTPRLYELAFARAKEAGVTHEDILVSMANEVPMNRLGRPDEIAGLVTFLASDRAGYITGTTIPVDGGIVKSVL